MKKIVLFTEGEGDDDAIPVLIGRLITDIDHSYWRHLAIDADVFRIGGIERITGKKRDQWVKKLKAAAKRPGMAGVLVVLDGDADQVEGQPFCSGKTAALLASRAKEIGGGTIFSLACVFARREFESWLLAGIDSLAGKLLSDGRPGVRAGASFDSRFVEDHPRDAKGALSTFMESGYKPTVDQRELTRLVDLNMIRKCNLRSFRRLESAVQELCEGIIAGRHFVSPL
jgi:hypothetical protein